MVLVKYWSLSRTTNNQAPAGFSTLEENFLILIDQSIFMNIIVYFSKQ